MQKSKAQDSNGSLALDTFTFTLIFTFDSNTALEVSPRQPTRTPLSRAQKYTGNRDIRHRSRKYSPRHPAHSGWPEESKDHPRHEMYSALRTESTYDVCRGKHKAGRLAGN
ncbi:hypothetical protein CH63R_08017 [Colletotrichum higginsianum IMI 349063]|uniref:Uncharacterized protein n=1 Tax=Colletotrichum higginsianum (strain IMI 349063) TaxID=759273 RepID=A0A1B7YB09_COLHI|nr:hypothetical protein CH63R_08017 [Colletotrichum higginsianum IMI 349063]OBR09252.1 hypothetical protein CH63R_08017 [Colletotrichum higginsianum IMI 349063]